MYDYGNDSPDTKPEATDEQLGGIARLVRLQISLEDAVAKAEADLKELKGRLQVVSEKQLPEAMIDAGTRRYDTTDGMTVEITSGVYPSVSKANMLKFAAWLRERGHADLLKRVISVAYTAGEDEKADNLRRLLEASNALDRGVDDATTVHPSTLKAFVKEQLEAGTQFPEDLIAIHQVDRAKISRPNN